MIILLKLYICDHCDCVHGIDLIVQNIVKEEFDAGMFEVLLKRGK